MIAQPLYPACMPQCRAMLVLATPIDASPLLHIDASPRKVGQVLWHPAAQQVLVSAVGDHTVKLWVLGIPESPCAVLSGHGDIIQSLMFNPTGQLVTTCRDHKMRLFEPCAGGDAIRVSEGHGGIAWYGWATAITSPCQALVAG